MVGTGRGVIATERDGVGIARIAARKGQAARVAELFRAQFGVEPPGTSRRASRGDVGIAAIAPETWLAAWFCAEAAEQATNPAMTRIEGHERIAGS